MLRSVELSPYYMYQLDIQVTPSRLGGAICTLTLTTPFGVLPLLAWLGLAGQPRPGTDQRGAVGGRGNWHRGPVRQSVAQPAAGLAQPGPARRPTVQRVLHRGEPAHCVSVETRSTSPHRGASHALFVCSPVPLAEHRTAPVCTR